MKPINRKVREEGAKHAKLNGAIIPLRSLRVIFATFAVNGFRLFYQPLFVSPYGRPFNLAFLLRMRQIALSM